MWLIYVGKYGLVPNEEIKMCHFLIPFTTWTVSRDIRVQTKFSDDLNRINYYQPNECLICHRMKRQGLFLYWSMKMYWKYQNTFIGSWFHLGRIMILSKWISEEWIDLCCELKALTNWQIKTIDIVRNNRYCPFQGNNPFHTCWLSFK